MSFADLPQVRARERGESVEQYQDHQANLLAIFRDALDFVINGNINSKNVFEVGGWRVTKDRLQSALGDVGMSSQHTGADDIRFWAGDTIDGSPKFKVTEAGIATLISAIIQSVASGERVVIDSTGLHSYDSSGVERITIGTTPAEGAKALIGRDTSGTARSVYTYDSATVDGSSRTGQFLTAHGCVVLLDNSGAIRLLDDSGGGFRALGAGNRPQISTNGLSWNDIAYKSEVDAKQDSFTGLTGAVGVMDSDGVTPKTLNFSNGVLTSVT